MVKPKPKEVDMIKVTHYVTKQHVIGIDRVRAKRLEAGARLSDVDKSSLMREALDLLLEREGV